MANFGQLLLTNLGIQEQYKAQSGEQLKFKRIAMGSGNYSGNVMALTKLVTENVSVDISKGYIQNNTFTVEGFFSNEDLQTGFAWREIGVYVEGAGGNEVLYCYANAGDTYDYIPATADERYSKNIRVAMAIGNATNVSIVESEGILYVDTQTFNAAVEGLQADVNQLWPSKEASGSAILVSDSAELPFVGMNIYGKSTQDGTPTTDAPVDIVSIAEATVMVSGSNLVNVQELNVSGNTSLSISEDGYKITAVGGSDKAYANSYMFLPIEILRGRTAYLLADSISQTCSSNVARVQVRVTNADGTYTYTSIGVTNFKNPFDVPSDATEVHFGVYTNNSSSALDSDNTVVVEGLRIALASDVAWVSYKEVQTISVPYTLPGIPVTSGGNYTDSDGQAWICDEIDLERGVYVQRVNSATYAGTDAEWIAVYGNVGNAFAIARLSNDLLPPESAEDVAAAFCDKLTATTMTELYAGGPNGKFAFSTSGNIIRFSLDELAGYTVDEVRAWLVENPLTFTYAIATPIETALASEQIAAYKALVAYNPNTTILNDAGAEMKVAYITNTFEPMMKEIVACKEIESAEHPSCFFRTVDGEMEWVNPPMVEDVEYRTTERHNGLPVYTSLLHFIIDASVEIWGSSVGISGITRLIRYAATVRENEDTWGLPYVNGSITVKTSRDILSVSTDIAVCDIERDLFCQVWYVKEVEE